MGGARHNLPAQPTGLIGREPDAAEALVLLRRDDVRLLTVTGPAGVGKSRLAVELASRLLPDVRDGAWLVDLTPIADARLVTATICQTLGLRETPGMPLLDSLRHYLADRQTLLVLDNFEHVLAAAAVVSDILAACPGVVVLVTSRAPLHLRWEHELPLAPLRLPDSGAGLDGAALGDVPAVALFVERARAVKPDFALDGPIADAVAALCIHLDGLPLAIELAAARVRLLSPQAMLARLGGGAAGTGSARAGARPLDLLTRGAQDVPARHQTLGAAIAWSYDLLNSEERALFRQLSVFVGGWTLDAAEHVASGERRAGSGDAAAPPIWDLLGVLIENHLVQQETEPDGEPRFRMLGTIREYALRALEESGEAEDVRRRHALYFMTLAERAETDLGGPAESAWLDRLEREHDNLRAALAWLSRSDQVDAGLRASRPLWRFWSVRGYLAEGREWLSLLLERDDAPTTPWARARALSSAGWIALEQDDIAAARLYCERGLALSRACGDDELVAEHLSQLGHVARQQGEYPVAEERYEESLAIRRRRGDRLGTAWSLRNLAHVARLRGDYDTACTLYEESLAVGGALAPRSEIAGTLGYLGNALLRRGDVEGAHRRLAESLAICRDLGHRRRMAYAIECLAGVAVARGEWERALSQAGAAAALREVIGAPLWPAGLTTLEHRLAPARQALGPSRAAEAWAAGRATPIDAAIRDALGEAIAGQAADASPAESDVGPAGVTPDALTPREREVVLLLARGLSNRRIADELVITEATAAVHVKHILHKLGLDSRVHVAAWAARHGVATAPAG